MPEPSDLKKIPARRDTLDALIRLLWGITAVTFFSLFSGLLKALGFRNKVLKISLSGLKDGLNVLPGIFVWRRGRQIEVLSQRCPHLGCSVGRDSVHGQLRCPCHGSRFTEQGQYISGPAGRDLQKLSARMEADMLIVQKKGRHEI